MTNLSIDYQGQAVNVLALMRHIVEHPLAGEYSPWFFTYFADLTGEAYMSRYVRFLRGWLAMCPGGIEERRVLDAGCGFGIMAVLTALLGANEVHGIDCNAGMIHTFKTYLSALPLSLAVFPRQGDVAQLPYEESSFDVVLSHEAISHYPDVSGFIAEAYRVLKPGGVLLLSDSNNARNRTVRQETWEIWRAFEEGPPGIHVHGHTVEDPFREQRARIIGELVAEESLPLGPAQIERLAQNTSGLAGQALRAAVRAYAQGGEMPGRVYEEGTCPVDPVQGYYIEYLFDPIELAEQLQSAGFQTRLRAYFGGARGGLLSVANEMLTWELLTPLALRLARAFRIVAVKDPHQRVRSRVCMSPC